jgi:rhodanese-related sulfurtransferase
MTPNNEENQLMRDTIDIEELDRRLQSDRPPILLEALPLAHYRQGHLPGALHLPHLEVRDRARSLIPRIDCPVVIYCASPSCANSRQAADALVALGYTDVAVFEAGKEGWQSAGRSLVNGDDADGNR